MTISLYSRKRLHRLTIRCSKTPPTLQKLAELMAEKEKTEAALEEKTERWIYLTDLAEQIEAQNQK